MALEYSIEDVREFFYKHFPLIKGVMDIVELGDGHATITLDGTNPNFIRPGNTVSGPGMFTLADVGSYLAIIGKVGEAGLMAVTSNCAMDFIRKPEVGLVTGKFEVLKFGRTLTVTDGRIYTGDTLVARTNFTYAMPKT
ncbi:MAG: PaaI family thioesterase [Pseudomonadota bacterium]